MYSLTQLRRIESWRVAFEAYNELDADAPDWILVMRERILTNTIEDALSAGVPLDQLTLLQREILSELVVESCAA